MRKTKAILLLAVAISFFLSGCDHNENSKIDESELFVTQGDEPSKRGDYDGATETVGNDAVSAENEQATREIVESDIYKVVGDTIWLVNSYKGLVSVDISNPKSMKILGKLPFRGVAKEMFLQGDAAYILVTDLNGDAAQTENGKYFENKSTSRLIIANIKDPQNPETRDVFDIEGTIVDSRQAGDAIYVVAAKYPYWLTDCRDAFEEGKEETTIVSIDIKNPDRARIADKIDIPGASYAIYVSPKSIYLAEGAEYDAFGNLSDSHPITLFDISDPRGKIVKKGVFYTAGVVGDRWKMHEEGNLFYAVSSNDNWGNGDSIIESFDISDPEKVAPIDKLVFMSGQKLYGTKFENDRVYAITYFQQDPLHVIDISDPSDLKQLGELAVPGWSTHLEIRGTKILAVGIDDDLNGNKTKISMYDVSDPTNPIEINTISFGDNHYSASEANQEWKAFKIFDDLGLILLPINDYDKNWRVLYYLYLIDFDLEKGLTKRGRILSESKVNRGVALDNLIVAIGERDVSVSDASDRDNPETLSSLAVAHQIENFTLCKNQLCGVQSYPSAKLVVYNPSSKNESDLIRWQSDPFGTSLSGFLKQKNRAYIYSCDDDSVKVKLIEFTDEKEQNQSAEFALTNDDFPNYGIKAAVSENGVAAFLNYGSSAWESAADYGRRFRNASAVLFDLSNPDVASPKAKNVLKNFETLDRKTEIFATGNVFWTTSCDFKGRDKQSGRELFYCYAVSIDASDASNPKVGAKINIPGKLIGISDDGEYFYTLAVEKIRDLYDSYDSGREETRTLYVLRLNDAKTAAEIVRQFDLSRNYYSRQEVGEDSYFVKNEFDAFFIKNDRIFFQKTISERYEDSNYSNYYYNRYCAMKDEKQKTEIKIVDVGGGETLFSKTFDAQLRGVSVENGGVLFFFEDIYGYYDYDYFPSIKEVRKKMNYVSVDGQETEFEISGDYYAYSAADYLYDGAPVVLKDALYIPLWLDGIYSLNLK